MRPSHDALLHKLRNLKSLQDNPGGVAWLLGELSHWYFIHEKRHPEWIARVIAQLHTQWGLAAGGGANFEIPENAVTTEDDPNSRSLQMVKYEGENGKILVLGKAPEGVDEDALRAVFGMRARNNTTPGPSHKSPVAYSNAHVGTGFTIPGVPGRFIWHGDDKTSKPPDMDRVVEIVARGLGLGEAPDLNDKKLKKKVREIIFHHTQIDVDEAECYCGAKFDLPDEWAQHVRKLIWKELKK